MKPLDLDRVRARLPDRAIEWVETTSSTMTDAARLAARGFPAGTAVVAEEQLLGQGRHGRAWHSAKHSGLYVSVLLPVATPPGALPVLTLALGLAVADAITRSTSLACDLRWPNDVLIGEKKCAGILAQLVGDIVIAGIGVNVNHPSFPPELEGIAASLRAASGRIHSREDLLVQLLESIDAFMKILTEDGTEQILRLFAQASSYVFGRRVTVEQDGPPLEGVTGGLDPSGFLILRRPDGSRCVIMAGGVRPYATGA